ncbi:MAG: hypothetical protein QM651_09380 [Rhodoblastus sp.]
MPSVEWKSRAVGKSNSGSFSKKLQQTVDRPKGSTRSDCHGDQQTPAGRGEVEQAQWLAQTVPSSSVSVGSPSTQSAETGAASQARVQDSPGGAGRSVASCALETGSDMEDLSSGAAKTGRDG